MYSFFFFVIKYLPFCLSYLSKMYGCVFRVYTSKSVPSLTVIVFVFLVCFFCTLFYVIHTYYTSIKDSLYDKDVFYRARKSHLRMRRNTFAVVIAILCHYTVKYIMCDIFPFGKCLKMIVLPGR